MVYHGICKYRAVHGGISRYMQSVFHGLCKYIAVQSGICQYEILSIQVHTGTYWYMRVHPRLTCFVPGCCSTLLARVKAAELQRPKDTLVQTETILLISSGIFLAPARRRHTCLAAGAGSAGACLAAAQGTASPPPPPPKMGTL